MYRSKKVYVMAVLGVAALVATGCSSSSSTESSSAAPAASESAPASSEAPQENAEAEASATPIGNGNKSVVVNLYSQALPYFQEIALGVTDAANAAGWESEVVFGQTDPALQFSQIQNSIAKTPGGIIVAPIDQASLIPVFKEASTAGVQMVAVADDILEEGWPSQLAYVGISYEEIGAQKAQRIVDALGGEGKVGVVHGIRGLHFSEGQWEGATEVFEANPGIELFDGGYAGGFSSDLGLKEAENLLTANPDLDAIYFDNDDLALGGILAVKNRGIEPEEIFIVGADGGKPAQDAAAAGDLDYSVSFCGYATGVQAFEVLRAAVEGGRTPENRIVPTPVIEFTPENVAELQSQVAAKAC